MKLIEINSEPRKLSEASKAAINSGLGIITYDSNNLYPNHILQVTQGSITARNCLRTNVRFLVGQGFKNKELNKFIVDKNKKLTLLSLLRAISFDYALFNGVSAHVKYNGAFEKVSVLPVNFQKVRLGVPDDKDYKNNVVVNKDWINYLVKNNEKIYLYDNVPEVIAAQVAKEKGKSIEEKIRQYKGQIFYYSCDGGLSYPLSTIDSVITDCSTEEGLSNIMYRNTRFNFLQAGILAKKGKSQPNQANQNISEMDKVLNEVIDEEEDTFPEDLANLQGDKSACKIGLIQYNFDEEKPEFISFESKNYDKDFTCTREAVAHNIGNVFNQPQILRMESVAGKLGSQDDLKTAYLAYNNFLQFDRQELQEIITELMSGFEGIPEGTDFEIEPLEFVSKNNVVDPKILEVIGNPAFSTEQKIEILVQLFKLNSDNAFKLFPKTNINSITK